MRLIRLDTHDPTLNLATEELLTQEAQEPVFMLWRNRPSIIVGRNQNTAAEINADFVRENAIRVVRRITGGGAVYHDLGNVNYSFIVPERRLGPETAAEFTGPVVAALRGLGVEAGFSGRNDILANGCKVSGCARCISRDHTLFHGTLLFDSRLDVLVRALRPDPEKIQSKGIQSVRARVANIRELLPESRPAMTTDAFLSYLEREVGAGFGGGEFTGPDEELSRRAERLADEKYRTWEWNYGFTMEYEVRRRFRFAGGIVMAEFNVRDNRLAALRFSGDFFGNRPVKELADALLDREPRRDTLMAALAAIPVDEFIAGVRPEEIAGLLAIG